MTIGFYRFLAAAGALVLGSTSAPAATVFYSDFGALGAHSGVGIDILGSGENGTSTQAASWFFTGAGSGTLDHLDIPMYYSAGLAGVSGVAIALVANDPATGFPALRTAALEEWIVNKGAFEKTNKLKLVSKLHPTLSANTYYWVVISSAGYDPYWEVFDNIVGVNQGWSSNDGGHTWGFYGASFAFDVWKQ